VYWESLRKGTTHVDVQRRYTNDTLLAENIRLRVDDDAQMVDLSIDLNKSLRSRSKGVNTYIDAKNLADVGFADFKAVTIDDGGVLTHINRTLSHLDFDVPAVWRLHVALRGDYWFNGRPEYREMNAHKGSVRNFVCEAGLAL